MTENTEKLIQFSDTIADLFTKYLDPYHNPLHVQEFTGWSDRFWTGEVVERSVTSRRLTFSTHVNSGYYI